MLESDTLSLRSARYEELDRSAREGRVVFRVWDSTSASKLRARENEFYGGFSAQQAEFGSMDAARFFTRYKALWCETTWVHHNSVRPLVIQHVSGKPFEAIYGAPSAGALTNYDIRRVGSPWISATASLHWAAAEIKRRLILAPDIPVHVSVIDLCKGGKEIYVVAEDILRRYEQASRIQRFPALHVEVNKARDMVEEAKEVLFFGRIFGMSIQEDLIFSATHCPFELPPNTNETPNICSPSYSHQESF